MIASTDDNKKYYIHVKVVVTPEYDCESTSTYASNRTAKKNKKINVTFNKERIREINRQNEILRKKLSSERNRRRLYTPEECARKIEASSYINRMEKQKQIAYENQVRIKEERTP